MINLQITSFLVQMTSDIGRGGLSFLVSNLCWWCSFIERKHENLNENKGCPSNGSEEIRLWLNTELPNDIKITCLRVWRRVAWVKFTVVSEGIPVFCLYVQDEECNIPSKCWQYITSTKKVKIKIFHSNTRIAKCLHIKIRAKWFWKGLYFTHLLKLHGILWTWDTQ